MRLLTSALALAAVLSPLAASADIGKVAAVNREMEGTPPVETTRLLVLGDTVYQDELVETSDSGSGQLLFVDQTTITIGPDSSVLLDSFIFDPDRQTGEIAASMAQGALRFIGGKITKFSAAEIRTPTATIAIRGGMVVIKVDQNGRTEVTNVAGSSVKVATYGDSDGDGLDDGPASDGDEPDNQVVLSRPGAQAVATAGIVTFTGLVGTESLGNTLASLDGTGTGGVGSPPSDEEIAAGIAALEPIGSLAPESPYAEPVATNGESDASDEAGDSPGEQPETIFEAGAVAELIDIPGEVVDPPQGGGGPIGEPGGIPDPAVIAALRGNALYTGAATGVDADLIENVVRPVDGTFTMSYSFDNRQGAFDLDIAGGVFSTDVAAPQGGENFFAGQSPILGGPSEFGVVGNFVEGADDPAAGVTGSFAVDLTQQERAITGTFDGTR